MNQTCQLFESCAEGNVLVINFKSPYINDTCNLEDLEDSLREML